LSLVAGEGVGGGTEERFSAPLIVWGYAPGVMQNSLQFIPNTTISAAPKANSTNINQLSSSVISYSNSSGAN
jgi:hypothetical protein